MSAIATAPPAVETIAATIETCDRCGARAGAVASKGDFRLFFCNHHARNSHPALAAASFSLTPLKV